MPMNYCHKLNNKWVQFYSTELSCSGVREHIFIGSKVDCRINNINIINSTGLIEFTFFNGEITKLFFSSQEFTFVAPGELARIDVELNGVNENGVTHSE